MPESSVAKLEARIAALEARVAQLEGGAKRPAAGRTGSSDRPAAKVASVAGWSQPYAVAEVEVSETWIEIHEPSARPQLQRLIRQVVELEGPVTDRLALDRIRRAWGLRRAGGRVQEAFDQALRQLLARGLVERAGDSLATPGRVLESVRVPTDDEATRRGAEDVPLVELALAIWRVTQGVGRGAVDDITMQVAKVFGWTRRGGAIQERLDLAVERAIDDRLVERAGTDLRPV
ncbi:MAG: hypothetical protein JWM90_2461 [Thermoleophilia bacterium]|nr:hypothetical protein [Thermoleophilia bacterium]